MLEILCSICYDNLAKIGVVTVATECGHLYHKTCMDRWTQKSTQCVDCRAKVQPTTVRRIFLSTWDFDESAEPIPDNILMKTNENLLADLREKEDTIANLQYVLAENETRMYYLSNELNDKKKKVQSLEKVIGDRNRKINEVEKKLRELQSEAKALKKRVSDITVNLTAQIESKEKSLAALKKSLTMLTRSHQIDCLDVSAISIDNESKNQSSNKGNRWRSKREST